MELSIQERLKDLRVERGLTLEQLAEQTHLSKSALGSYEGDNFKDISHYALIELAKFYEVTVDYLLGRSQTKNHPNADLVTSRHRGAKPLRRYELLGGISLLSPEYLLSFERCPFHTETPDHYALVSYLIDLSVSQSSALMPLHSNGGYQSP